ncbi:transcriptional regulator with XRE-family HTH domain [Clostridium beijerinckii]|uniref:helix-turn-helix transcriptional regulator n=1 Tax=Clostridium beijerinckii TaxID=1520 RepID=UPI001494483B|nr:helix-turn-helix transcriptional regulator [Clostridium beijerinckii]NOW86753.1 transcriptional regulator with XRE-family HTH domain [Clostridium beijerinckii]
MTIGNAIKLYRASQGLTQCDLAVKLNKTSRTIQKYECGQIVPNIKIINEIFNIKIEEIISNELLEKRGI